MSNVIILYDIAADNLPGQPWNPNTMKTRFSLNFKNLPFKTVFLKYGEIAEKLQAAGIPPSSVNADGTPSYTCPAIFDPTTKTALAESAAIAAYLDKQYPNTPKLFPVGTSALQSAFLDNLMGKISAIFRIGVAASNRQLAGSSEEYFRTTREKMFGLSMDKMDPVGEERVQEWAKLKAGFEKLDEWLQASKSDGPYFLGKEPGFADFVVASFLIWARVTLGEKSKEWQDVRTWSEGRWAQYLDGLKKFETVL